MYGIGKILLFLCLSLSLCGGLAHAEDRATAKPGENALYGGGTHDGAVTIPESRTPPMATGVDGPGPAAQKKRDMTGFWVIGILINIVVMSAFAVWAVGQWRKSGR
jgi:hypothetical protein